MYWICFIYLLHTSIPCGKYTHTRVTSTTVFSHTVTRNIILSLNEYAMMCFFDALECMNISPPMLLWIERCDGDFISFKKNKPPPKKTEKEESDQCTYDWQTCVLYIFLLYTIPSHSTLLFFVCNVKNVYDRQKKKKRGR